MKTVLAVNAGSSSLKYALFGGGDPPPRLLGGRFERIGHPGGPSSHGACLDPLLEQIGGRPVGAVGHRIVHGGPRYVQPAAVDASVLDELRRISPFDPQHLPAQIALIEATARKFPGVPQIACFDTAFHRDLPDVSRVLPLPREYADRGIRRYGFHGLSYEFVLDELQRQGLKGRMILAHLGSGASLAAVRDGTCIDTTMSFTPASGIPQSTRSGDLDPGLYPYLAKTEGMTPERWTALVNGNAGVRGVSGSGADFRAMLEDTGEDHDRFLALEMFVYHVRKAVGALAAALGGLDVLAFSGGIGENAPTIREDVCAGLAFLGISLDVARNRKNEPRISADDARVQVRVVRTDEELQIAKTLRKHFGL